MTVKKSEEAKPIKGREGSLCPSLPGGDIPKRKGKGIQRIK